MRCYSSSSSATARAPVKARIYSVAPHTTRHQGHTKPSTSSTGSSRPDHLYSSNNGNPNNKLKSLLQSTAAPATTTKSTPKSWVLNWGKPGDLVDPFKFRTCQDAVMFAVGQGWDYTIEGTAGISSGNGDCTGCP